MPSSFFTHVKRFNKAFKKYFKSTNGNTAIEFVIVVGPLCALMFFVLEIAFFFFFAESISKAAQMGARYAIVSEAAVSNLPELNALKDGFEEGEHCSLEPSPCVTPTPLRWSCAGGVGSGDGECTDAFDEIVDRMRALVPWLRRGDVTVTYVHSGLGRAGGPFVPTVIVDVENAQSPIGFLNALHSLYFGPVDLSTAPRLRAVYTAEDIAPRS